MADSNWKVSFRLPGDGRRYGYLEGWTEGGKARVRVGPSIYMVDRALLTHEVG